MSARNSSTEEIKSHWRAFKSIETRTPADIDRQLLLLTDDVVMENPMMRVEGRDAVREFLLQDIYWSKPVIDWECFSSDRVAFRWSQYPLCTEKSDPMLLHACSTWKYGSGGRFTHYYATWCRVEAFRVMRDAEMPVPLENILGPEFGFASDGE